MLLVAFIYYIYIALSVVVNSQNFFVGFFVSFSAIFSYISFTYANMILACALFGFIRKMYEMKT